MASPAVGIATGASLSFTGLTDLNNREILDFTLPEASVDVILASHQGSLTAHKYIAAVLKEYGSLVLILHHWQDYNYFSDIGTKNRVTITLPSTATITFTGILQRYTPQQATLNDKMSAEAEIKLSGDTNESTLVETIVITTGS